MLCCFKYVQCGHYECMYNCICDVNEFKICVCTLSFGRISTQWKLVDHLFCQTQSELLQRSVFLKLYECNALIKLAHL